jgi:hypothetical protein
MEIVLLLAGLVCLALGGAILYSEIRERNGTCVVTGRVIGFSTGAGMNTGAYSYYSVAQYTGPNGRNYYVEGSVGSSVPLNTVGDAVTVFVDPQQPEKAEIKSTLLVVLGASLAAVGLIFVVVFFRIFQVNLYSVVMAGFVLGTLCLKAKRAWDKHPISLKDLRQQYKETTVVNSRVFTEESKKQIVWADPVRLAAAIETYQRQNRYAAPVLMVFGFALVFLGIYLYQRETTFLRKAIGAEGHVVGLKAIDSSSTSHSTTYAAVVEYTDVSGHKRQFTDSLSSSPPSYHSGDRVNVLYIRENAIQSQIDRGAFGNRWPSILCGVLGGLCSLLGLSILRKRQQRRFS